MSEQSTFQYRPESDFHRRSHFDFIKRALPGIYLYIAAWPILFLWTGFHEKHPFISGIFGFGFISISLLRLMHTQMTESHYDDNRFAWQYGLYILVLAHAGFWGALFYFANFDPRFAVIVTPVNLVIAGIASASMISLIPIYWLAQVYVALLLVPTGVASAFTNGMWQLCLIILIYWLYLIFIGRRFHKEYVRAFEIEKALFTKTVELEQQSITDRLTKAFNRLHFDQYLQEQWHKAVNEQQGISLLILDVDHFKKINDQFGHLVGDHCLQHATHLISQCAEKLKAPVFRYGGEEFVVLVNSEHSASVEQLTENILNAFRETPYQEGQIHHPMTISIGVCQLIASTKLTVETLLKEADDALYLAKQRGRNRAEFSQFSQGIKA
ncbi:MAG: diguanylate cyclase [Alteromonadaceae bacterium]|nr:diguanylate cyclase [Alteromonadaceae bacterium]